MLLMDLAEQCRKIVQKAVVELGSDLQGYSVIDLCADNVDSGVSISDIKCALVCSGVDNLLSRRLVCSYSR
jgi:hypothetical protein